MALILPLYLTLHLHTSPTASSSLPATTRARLLSIDAHTARLIPYSVAIGAGLPTLAVLLSPKGSVAQQTALVVRQVHPLVTAIALYSLKALTGSSSQTSTQQQQRTLHPALKRVYTLAFLLASTTHLLSLFLILLKYHGTISLRSVFIPPFPDFTHKVATFAEGAHVFLRWDECVSLAALVVWAGSVHSVGVSSSSSGGAGKWMKMAGCFLLGGPAGLAVMLVRERDEVVFRQAALEGEGVGDVEGKKGM